MGANGAVRVCQLFDHTVIFDADNGRLGRFDRVGIVAVIDGPALLNAAYACQDACPQQSRQFSKVWDHAANKRKALFLSSWNCSIARVGEGETDFNILSAKPIREKMFRGASSLRFV